MVSNANANNIPAYSLHSKFVNNIIDSMVLWYDIKRQGATNESMSQKPVLRDLSGNGHDATCYNFGWGRMSGIGGYATNFNAWVTTSPNEIINKTNNSFTITKTSGVNNESILYIEDFSGTLKFKVSGLTEGDLLLTTRHTNEINIVITEDGIYEYKYSVKSVAFKSNTKRDSCNITIEQIAEYPNALVSDGVDDYAIVNNTPTSYPLGYTVIAKRDWLNTDRNAGLCAERYDSASHSAFVIEKLNYPRTGVFQCESFKYSETVDINILQKNGIIYQTTFNYNGQIDINVPSGYKRDSYGSVVFFKLNSQELNFYNGSLALYSFLLFNRDLTYEEIEWVKTNLINNSPLFNIYSFSSANRTTQITYAVNDTLVINTTGENGSWLVRGDINLLKTSFNITCDRRMYLAIADMPDSNTVNKQKRYFELYAGLNTVPVISDEDFSQYNTLVICRPSDDAAGEYTIKAL